MTKKRKYTAPGVYVQEVPSGVQQIEGVPTAVTAFVGRTMTGPVDDPVAVTNFTEFVRVFGELDKELPLTHAVQDYFMNGGSQALIVRVWKGAAGGALQPDHAGERLTLVEDFTGREEEQSGIYALLKVDLFNQLCIPPDGRADGDGANVPQDVWREAAVFCEKQRAFLIVDPRVEWGADAGTAVEAAQAGWQAFGTSGAEWRNAALYFPRVVKRIVAGSSRRDVFAPCGIVAGIMTRTDITRGIWKAPAGVGARIQGIDSLQVNLSDDENGRLNRLGINCLRNFPTLGDVVWGSRTLRGADEFSDEFKYVPLSRLALYLEESIFRGTLWAVFEPNNINLWSRLRASVEPFLFDLFRQGALAGPRAEDAFFVRCDMSTMTQNDIDNGLVKILVGFAPLRPAEFVIISIQQLAGQ